MKAAMIATWDWGLEAVSEGVARLKAGESALDAVEAGIRLVEDDPKVLSVGLGGLPNLNGEVELDAAVMDGESLKAGAVGALKEIRHPISVARKVMELTPHVLLVGEGALSFAQTCGFRREQAWKPEAQERWRKSRAELDSTTKLHGQNDAYLDRIGEFSAKFPFPRPPASCDTVSAVAIDRRGKLAAGNSTTRLFMKLPGRVGDSPIIGAGLYADNRVGGAAATGIGEIAVVYCLSKRVCDLMAGGLKPHEACQTAIDETRLPRGYPGEVSVMALGKNGNPGAATSRQEGFAYAYQREDMAQPLALRAPLL